ncbi:MAG: ABC transporter substrate-binding protein, partial [Angustibacter sp.]
GTGTVVTKAGGKNWQIIYPDYAFGQDMNKSFTAAVQKAGGTVGASIATPFPNDNFATFLTKAAAAKPNVIGAMQAGGDLVTLVKQFNEQKLREKGITLAAGLLFVTDIHAAGADQFQGVEFTDPWYWDFDQQNRDWAAKFEARTHTKPSMAHAANYSAAMQYLEAVQATGTDNADDVVKNLEGKKINDFFLRNGEIRAKDHRVIHDVYLAKVKPADQVKKEWDLEDIVSTIPAAEAFKPESESTCSM